MPHSLNKVNDPMLKEIIVACTKLSKSARYGRERERERERGRRREREREGEEEREREGEGERGGRRKRVMI